MFELLKAAAWRYIKLVVAETIYDVKKEIRKREKEEHDDDPPKMEGSLHTTTDFQRPDLLWQDNQITAHGFGFTSDRTNRIRS